MKRIVSLIMALVLVLGLAVTVSAATVTIDGATEGNTYKAFRLLNATDGGDGKYAYTVDNAKGQRAAVVAVIGGEPTDKEIIAYIEALTDEQVPEFAEAVYNKIVELGIEATSSRTASSSNMAEGKLTWTPLNPGYYLIAETVKAGAEDTRSLFILDTVGNENITITLKEETPTVEKYINEDEKATAAAVGDKVNFKIVGTVSNQYANYDSYHYEFVDTMYAGLTMSEDPWTITIDGVDVTTQFAHTLNGEAEQEEHHWTADLKTVTGVEINGEAEVVLTYTATLTSSANMTTTGNRNKVQLVYANDPYTDATTTSSASDAKVYTFKLTVNKTDGTNPLAGAGFTLYKKNAEGEYVAVGDEIKDVTSFVFNRLDTGDYKLVESTVPAGYNKADDIEFTINATFDGINLDEMTVTGADGFTVDGATITTTVINQAGTELPETGGIGTTLFYVFGGMMVLAAVVVLVSKKRMANAE